MREKILIFLGVLATTVVSEGLYGKLIFPPLPVSVLDSENAECKAHSDVYIQNLENFTLWASEMITFSIIDRFSKFKAHIEAETSDKKTLEPEWTENEHSKLWDATAKSPSGFLSGNVFHMGHFEQCISAEAPFQTQYCLAMLKANAPKAKNGRDEISLYFDPEQPLWERLYPNEDQTQQPRNVIQMGWCVPASCTPKNLEDFLNSYINEIDLPLRKNNVTFTAKFTDLACHTASEQGIISGADIAFCLLTGVLVLLVIVVTIQDFKSEDEQTKKPVRKSLLNRLLVTFSARKNIAEMSRADESNPAMTLLYGMRNYCILMIILDHRFATFTSSALTNFDYVEKQYRSPFACIIFHGDLFVDSFFVLSGLLVAYGLLAQFDKKKMNPGFIILMRYIRLTPPYAFVIFYYATLFDHTGSGPLWKIIAGQDSQDCKDNWWTNLLYISNYVNVDHMCMAHSWYLPCDFHYFIIGIGVCLLIKKDKKIGLTALACITIVSVLIPFAITIIYTRPALLYFYPEFLTGPKIHPDFKLTYTKSHTRATPYFIGMFAGYIYYRLKGTNKHVCRIKSYAILLVSIFLILIALLSGAVFYNPYHKYNSIEAASYAGLHRAAFAVGTSGILYVSSFGHAKIIYNILSWWPWIPLSKLTYGAYLIHFQFQLRSAAKFMNPRAFSYFDVISLALSDMILAFVSALGLYLIIEAPSRKILRELLMPPKEATKEPTEVAVRENMITTNGTVDSRL